MTMTDTFFPEHLKRWTHPENYVGETWPNYYSAGVGQSRDSDALERANFDAMAAALKVNGELPDTVEVVHEGHWAVGWVEWIAIESSDARSLRIADEIKGKLADYPVVNEELWSEYEDEEAQQIWRNCYNWRERIKYIRENEYQFEFHNFAHVIGCVRGHYFTGYASELIR